MKTYGSSGVNDTGSVRRSMPYFATEWLRKHARTDIVCRVCKVAPRDQHPSFAMATLDAVARSGKYGPVIEYECSLCAQGLTPEAKARNDARRTDRERDQARLRQEKRRTAISLQETPVTLEGPGQVNGQTPPVERDSVSSKPASDKESVGGVDMTRPSPSVKTRRGGRPRVHADRKAAQQAASKAYRARQKEKAA